MEQINLKERTELIEVIISNIGVQEFPIGQLPNLRNASKIIRIEALRFTQVPVAPTGKAVVNETVFPKAFLRLINSDNVEFRAYSLVSLSKSVNGTEIPAINSPRIDPEKSKIVVGSTAGLILNEVFLLQITYEK